MIEFSKMAGHGNDFIMIDDRAGELGCDWSACAVSWCRRREGIGADGIIVVEGSDRADFRMRIFNADGSEAEMCGNGARCAASFALKKGIAGSRMSFETLAGVIEARVEGGEAAVKLTDPQNVKGNIELFIGGEELSLYHANTGVPHTILFVDDIDGVSVGGYGREIRFHPHFAPQGTNVDFVKVEGPGNIRVRTYERGVEAETLACGTGAVASAVISSLYGDAGDSPVDVFMPGGKLSVSFVRDGDECSDVWLSGRVEWIYNGESLQEVYR